MNLDFDTIEIPEEKLNRTIQNNIKKVHGIHRKQMIRHTAGLFCAAAFFYIKCFIFNIFMNDNKQKNCLSSFIDIEYFVVYLMGFIATNFIILGGKI